MATSTSMLISGISSARMAPYLLEAQENQKKALQIYRWNAELSGAIQVVLGHTEVLLRNAVDRQIQAWCARQINPTQSWLLVEPPAPLRSLTRTQRDRARNMAASAVLGRTTTNPAYGQPLAHDDVVAQLNFGVWKALLPNHSPNANPQSLNYRNRMRLWDEAIQYAFPHIHDPLGVITSHRVTRLVDLRNRVAHMEVVKDLPISERMKDAFALVGSIDPTFEQWLAGVSRVSEVLKQRPKI